MAKDLTQALHDLTQQAQGHTSRKDQALPAVKPVSAIPERNGLGRPGGSGGTGSIASPLAETDYAARQHWDEQTISSTDGLFTIKIKPVKMVVFIDANGANVQMIYAQPT